MFTFGKVKHQDTCHGVRVEGIILCDGNWVGNFYNEPFAACITRFEDGNVREAFAEAAKEKGLHVCNFAETLLQAAEDLLLKKR